MFIKRIILTAGIVTFSLLITCAQDKIITWKGDTIEGRVIRKGNKSIFFEKYEGSVRTTGSIDRLEVRELQMGEKAGSVPESNLPYHTLDLAVAAGPSYLVASTKDARTQAVQLGMTREQADSYYRQLKLGWSGSAQAHWYFLPGMGAGLHYRFFVSGASEWVTLDPQDGVNLYYGEMKEKMYVSYLAPSLKTVQRYGKEGKFIVSSAVSAGITFYRDEASILQNNVLLTGKAFGTSLEIGTDYLITDHLSMGLKIGLFSSKLRKVTMDNGTDQSTVELDKEKYENVSAADLSAVIRITL